MNYTEQLKHPMWQKRRLEIMELNNFICENCEDKETTLHIHHKYYEKGRKVWEYPNGAYSCLCQPCHEAEHILDDRIKKVISFLPPASKETLLGYALVLGDPFPPIIPLSPDLIDGMADYFRISSTKLFRFLMDNKQADLFDVAKFARDFYTSTDDFIRRGL